jgi:hypothetical protein
MHAHIHAHAWTHIYIHKCINIYMYMHACIAHARTRIHVAWQNDRFFLARLPSKNKTMREGTVNKERQEGKCDRPGHCGIENSSWEGRENREPGGKEGDAGPHTVQSDTTRCGDSRVGHAAKRPVLQPIDSTSQCIIRTILYYIG